MIYQLLKKITSSLEGKNIPYMVSGSVALAAYTIPRMTLDVDIVIELNEQNINDFLSIFSNSFYLHQPTIYEETKRKGMFNIIDYETGYKVDFIVRKETEFRKLEFSHRKRITINDIELWAVTPEDLVLSKIQWIQDFQSEKQISDIKNLLAIPTIDKEYIKSWCEKLNLKIFNLF